MLTFVGSDTVTGNGTGILNPTIPNNVLPGDTMLLFVTADKYTGGVALTTPPAGWTELGQSASGTTNLGIVYERIATIDDAGKTVNVVFDAFAAGASLRAYRGAAFSFTGWVDGLRLDLEVNLAAGETLVAFAWCAGPAQPSSFLDPTGAFDREDFHQPKLFPQWGEYAFATLTGVAPTRVTTVRVEASDAANWQSVWAFGARGRDAGDHPRVRSSVSEDAGSLFQATQAVAVELGISEAFEYGADAGSSLRVFREALTPDEAALRYYAVPTRNQEMLATVEGETNLGRLAHTIAPRIFTRGQDIPGNVDGVVTAQQAIQFVVDQFAAEHPWLVFEPIPDFRALEPDAVGNERQYYIDNPDAGVLTIPNVVIEQEGNERRTMREVLDEWVAVFAGTTLRQTSRGTIEYVPRVGPDAPDGAALTLAWRDLARMSDGENDPRGVYNHARVTSQGWDWVENQGLIPPSFTVVRGENGLERSVLDSEEVLPTDREEFEPWAAVEFEVMASQDAVEVDVGLTAFGSWSQNTAMSFSIEGTTSHNFTLLPGQRRDVTLQHTSRSNNVVFRTRVTRAPEGDRITLSWPSGVPADARNIFGITFLAYEVTLDVGGTAWTRSNQSIEAEWGTEEHEIPAVGGGDALAQSRAQYGVRSATIQSNIFQLTSEQAMAVARGYVLHNINPRTVRDVQQSEWDRYPVKFDHIGRYVELPNGEVAVVENRSYSDSFAPRASAMMSNFTATVSHSVIDTSTQYLFNSDGSYWENDDGTLSEVL